MRAVRIALMLLATALPFAMGMATQQYLDAGVMNRLERNIRGNMLLLAAPLYECRAGREWTGMEGWNERYEGCDFDCALNMLLMQAQAKDAETTVADQKAIDLDERAGRVEGTFR